MKAYNIIKKHITAEELAKLLKKSPKHCKKLLAGSKPFTEPALKKVCKGTGLNFEELWKSQQENPKKIKPKGTTTPRGQIASALRILFLRSRERREACKRARNRCEKCNTKINKDVKGEVHHLDGIDWDAIEKVVREKLLCDPKRLTLICKKCHNQEHYREAKKC